MSSKQSRGQHCDINMLAATQREGAAAKRSEKQRANTQRAAEDQWFTNSISGCSIACANQIITSCSAWF